MRKYLITGLIILLPLAVTIGIIVFIVDFLTKPFMGAVTSWLAKYNLLSHGFLFFSSEQLIRYGSQFIILICLFLITLFVGIITRWFFVRTLIHWSDKLLNRIPIVNKVYKTTQEVIRTLFSTEKNTFNKVVLCALPMTGGYAIGLVSHTAPKVCSQAAESDLISVFIPTTPNPTSGYLIMYRKEEIIPVDMTLEEAVKYVVSCGVILPEEKSISAEEIEAQKPLEPSNPQQSQ